MFGGIENHVILNSLREGSTAGANVQNFNEAEWSKKKKKTYAELF